MRNKMFLLFGVMTLLIVALVTRQSMLLADMQSNLDTQINNVAGEYQDIAERYAIPLATYDSFTNGQRSAMVNIRKQYSSLHNTTEMVDAVQDIIALQISLHAFVKATSPESAVATDGRYLTLKSRIGEGGNARVLLKEYNNTAKQWNNQISDVTASLTLNLRQIDRTTLPYLHYLGKENNAQVISL